MGQRSTGDIGLQHSAKVEVAENWRSLAGKGRTLEALQNERYCSPCSLPGDRYDAWTGLLPAATAALLQGIPRPRMLWPAVPARRARSQGKAAGRQWTTFLSAPLCPVPQAAHDVSCVGLMEG